MRHGRWGADECLKEKRESRFAAVAVYGSTIAAYLAF
jgi:hypothetical protein